MRLGAGTRRARCFVLVLRLPAGRHFQYIRVLSVLYSGKPLCLFTHLLCWIFQLQPVLRCQKSVLLINDYAEEFRQIVYRQNT